MNTCVQNVYWAALSETTLASVEEHRIGQRENLFCVSVSTEASTNSMKFLELQVKKPLHTQITECGLSYSITTETSEEIQSSRNVHHLKKKKKKSDFPGGPVVKNLCANAADVGSVPRLGRFHRPSS